MNRIGFDFSGLVWQGLGWAVGLEWAGMCNGGWWPLHLPFGWAIVNWDFPFVESGCISVDWIGVETGLELGGSDWIAMRWFGLKSFGFD